MKIAVIGAGSWGTALSGVLAANGHNVSLWARKPQVVSSINKDHVNPRYLSDSVLPASIVATTSYRDALRNAQAAVVVTPSKLLRGVAQALDGVVEGGFPVVICSKGVEEGSGLLPAQIFHDELGDACSVAVLSGPNHAEEVVKGTPSATVVASEDAQTAALFQTLFANDAFRVYTSDDVTGVELCAAFKNVIAIAVGLSYGLGYGDNTAAMLMTRGLAEMSRLVESCGGQALTCLGLAGAGDLMVTCMSRHSRNRRFGEMLARGGSLQAFSDETHMVAEGAYACQSLGVLSAAFGVELPITDVIRSVVWDGADPRLLAQELSARPLKPEFW
ncbi:NAD(P)H-dependent glycerol-3-phosphate dehydrogenase [Adlercreutzia aquisgranensis]|uniref:NAD(P)H-dependent glycerol-3-phosphate dehydrogenase n=1 Tax=Adlercreutzia aquisgranensis TaxID=2941323 RepID=UPI00203DCEC4|nr:NAD(P)H-dependent glycerol-3-phosphate dehydrogenase [Adlercreutzia aquisgranensis]